MHGRGREARRRRTRRRRARAGGGGGRERGRASSALRNSSRRPGQARQVPWPKSITQHALPPTLSAIGPTRTSSRLRQPPTLQGSCRFHPSNTPSHLLMIYTKTTAMLSAPHRLSPRPRRTSPQPQISFAAWTINTNFARCSCIRVRSQSRTLHRTICRWCHLFTDRVPFEHRCESTLGANRDPAHPVIVSRALRHTSGTYWFSASSYDRSGSPCDMISAAACTRSLIVSMSSSC